MSYCKLILGRLHVVSVVKLTLFRCHQLYCTVLLQNVTYITTAMLIVNLQYLIALQDKGK